MQGESVCVWNFRNATFQSDRGHASRNQAVVRADQNDTLYMEMSKISVGSYCYSLGSALQPTWNDSYSYSLQPLHHHFRNIYVLFLHFKLHAYIFLLRPNQKRVSGVIILVWPKLCFFFVTVCHLWWSLSLSFVALCLPLLAHTLCKYRVEATEQSYLQLDRQ